MECRRNARERGACRDMRQERTVEIKLPLKAGVLRLVEKTRHDGGREHFRLVNLEGASAACERRGNHGVRERNGTSTQRKRKMLGRRFLESIEINATHCGSQETIESIPSDII